MQLQVELKSRDGEEALLREQLATLGKEKDTAIAALQTEHRQLNKQITELQDREQAR